MPDGFGPHRALLRQPNRFARQLFPNAQPPGKIPDDRRQWRRGLCRLVCRGLHRKSSTQGHAAQRAVTQDELMPDGHQGVQSGEDEDDGSGILMQFAIRPVRP